MKLFFQRAVEHHLQEAIDQLPPIQQTLITLFHLEDVSLNELCQVVNMPLGTVKSHLFRARKKPSPVSVNPFNQ